MDLKLNKRMCCFKIMHPLIVCECMCNFIILCFQLEDAAMESFEKAVKEDNVPLTFDAFGNLQKLDEYFETWHVWILDHGFLSMFW
jgi:hypothetical protein